MHEERVWNEYDGRDQLFPWTPNQTKEWWNLHQSSQVYKRAYQEIGLENAKISKTLMATTTKLDKDEQGNNVNKTLS